MFAFVGFSKGKSKLIIVDVFDGKLVQEFSIPGVPSFNYPAWSPDGNSIVVSGLVNGINDLYQYDLTTKKVIRLTSDPWCNIHPAWSSDGKSIVFSTDKPSQTSISKTTGYNLATLDIETKAITVLDILPGA